MRRAGRFRRSRYSQVVPAPEDEGAVLEDKWLGWVEVESMKRRVLTTSFYVITFSFTPDLRFT